MIYLFGQYILNTQTRQLWCDDKEVKVEPRVYALLQLLLENADKALSKDEIHQAIWPGQVLTDTALSRLIMKARKALSDNSGKPLYIKTVHGFGFQFIASVNIQDDAIPAEPISPRQPQELAADSGNETRPYTWRAVGLLAVLAIVLAFVFTIRQAPESQNAQLTRVAILPLQIDIEDPEQAWLGLGLASLTATLVDESSAFNVVPVKALINFSQQRQSDTGLTQHVFNQIQNMHQASWVVDASLSKHGKLYTLTYAIYQQTRQQPRYSISAEDPSQLAIELSRAILQKQGQTKPEPSDFTVSASDFINQAYAKAKVQLIAGNIETARDLLQVIVNEDDALFWPQYDLALTSRKLGFWQEAEQQLLNLLSHPGLPELKRAESKTRNALGFVYYRQKRYDDALAQYQLAFELAHANLNYALMAGIADNVAGIFWIRYDFEPARSWLNRAIRLRSDAQLPATGHAYNMLGLLERDQGNLVAARRQFERAAEVFGADGMMRDYNFSQINLSTIDQHMGLYQQAVTRLDAVQSAFAEQGEREALSYLHDRFGNVYIALQNFEQAAAHLEQASLEAEKLNSAARLANVRFSLAKLALAQNNSQQAAVYLHQVTDYLDEVWAPQVAFLQLARLQQNEQEFELVMERANADAEQKVDALYQLYIQFELGRFRLYQGDNQAFLDLSKDVIKDARLLQAHAILSQQLAELIRFYVQIGDEEKASQYLLELEMLSPTWPVTEDLRRTIGSGPTAENV